MFIMNIALVILIFISLPCIGSASPICQASATLPTYQEGQQVPCSADLNGRANINGSFTSTAPALTKGVQGATGYSFQSLTDAGRTYVTLTANVLSASLSLVMQPLQINIGGSVTTGNDYIVSAGKTFVMQAYSINIFAFNRTCPNDLFLFADTSTLTTASKRLLIMHPPLTQLSLGYGDTEMVVMPEGVQIPSGTHIGFAQDFPSTQCQFTLSITGYEY